MALNSSAGTDIETEVFCSFSPKFSLKAWVQWHHYAQAIFKRLSHLQHLSPKFSLAYPRTLDAGLWCSKLLKMN